MADEVGAAQRMFLDAGLVDVAVAPERLTGFQKLELAGEDTVRALEGAALLHGVKPPMCRRILEPS